MAQQQQQGGWVERQCAGYLTKRGWTVDKSGGTSFYAGKQVDVDASVDQLIKMQHVDAAGDGADSAASAQLSQLKPPGDVALARHDPSRFVPKWKEWMSPDNTDDVVVVPSLSLDADELQKVTGVQFYEERALGFSVLQLCEPTKRVVYCTSAPVAEEILQYYLRIVCGRRGVNPRQARERLLMICCHDTEPLQNLSAKLLKRPRLLRQIKAFVRAEASYMVCFISTPAEARLGDVLQLEVLGTHPELQYYGTKIGSRALFAEAGVPHPDGTELQYTEGDLAMRVAELWERCKAERIVVKLNEGFSGEGNALMKMDSARMSAAADTRARAKVVEAAFPTSECNWSHFPPPSPPALSVPLAPPHYQLHRRWRAVEFNNDVWDHFRLGIVKMGALGEAWVEGVSTSPSCQVYITPDSQVEVVSTHEQILNGQVFLG
jgi:hypothetical protein